MKDGKESAIGSGYKNNLGIGNCKFRDFEMGMTCIVGTRKQPERGEYILAPDEVTKVSMKPIMYL